MALPFEFVNPFEAFRRSAAVAANKLTPEGGQRPFVDYTVAGAGMTPPAVAPVAAPKPVQQASAVTPPSAPQTPKQPQPNQGGTAAPQPTEPTIAQNTIYRWQDAKGVTNYGNVGAPKGATALMSAGMPSPATAAQPQRSVMDIYNNASKIYQGMGAGLSPQLKEQLAYFNAKQATEGQNALEKQSVAGEYGLKERALANEGAMATTKAAGESALERQQIASNATLKAAETAAGGKVNAADYITYKQSDPTGMQMMTYKVPKSEVLKAYHERYAGATSDAERSELTARLRELGIDPNQQGK